MSASHQLTYEMIALLRRKMEARSMTKSKLSKRMEISASAVTKLVNEGSELSVDRLYELSVAMEFNFFAVVAQKEPLRNFAGAPVDPRITALEEQLATVTQRMHDLEIENQTLLKVLQHPKA